ncbi:hypothetical protein AGOR_G00092300 [Albula goreensis]|uniref:Fibronectin type-III domain-containing protein n=1 Tax=Albula goreensis TaxID=1534307 RepID=A0A8T3DK14_9TELE|nr:hypothetical protein AGOR_G00092300 [Albula goreensis]
MVFFLLFLLYIAFIAGTSHEVNGGLLSCISDFDRTMMCSWTYYEPGKCSQYNLSFTSLHGSPQYNCSLIKNKNDSRFKCGCTIQMEEFVFDERYNACVQKGGSIIHSTQINPSGHIKPKAPEILSVCQNDAGNFNVTWKTNYRDSAFSDTLRTELQYRRKGDPDKVARVINASQPYQEIPGSGLEAGREYVIKARIFSSDYNTQFSDWSAEVEWTNPASVEDQLKIAIPVLCVILIIGICVCHWCNEKLKAIYKKIPDPSKASLDKILPADYKVLQPPENPPVSFLRMDQKPRIPLLSDASFGSVHTDPDYRNVGVASVQCSGLFSSTNSDCKCQNDSQGFWSSSESGYQSSPCSPVTNESKSFSDFFCKGNTGNGSDLALRFSLFSDVDQNIERNMSCSMNPFYACHVSHVENLAARKEEYQTPQSQLLQQSRGLWSSADSDNQEDFSNMEYSRVLSQFPVTQVFSDIITCVSEHDSMLKLREAMQKGGADHRQICIDEAYQCM